MDDLKNKIEEVIYFWFEELSPRDWWIKSEKLDLTIKERFLKLHQIASKGELLPIRTTPEAKLAEIIILDQFSRNIYRETPKAFAYDSQALELAKETVASGDDQKLPVEKRKFIYMPYMHSESLEVHDEALALFKSLDGDEKTLNFEKAHRDIIERFGRYPHRNKILGRVSTQQELDFLAQPGSSF